MAYAELTEEDKAEIDRLIKSARFDVERSDRLTKRAKGILTKAHYYLLNGAESMRSNKEAVTEEVEETAPVIEDDSVELDIPEEITNVLNNS